MRQKLFLLLLPLALSACASYDLPPLPASSAERLPGKVVWYDLITDTPRESRRFYGDLFGWEFESVPGVNYTLIRHQGRAIGGLVDQTALPLEGDPSQWVVLLATADIDAATGTISAAGGRVLTPPRSLGRRGRIAVATDPEGALFALLEGVHGDPGDAADSAAIGSFLWTELWSMDPQAAAAFYAGLLPYERRTVTVAENTAYEILASGGRPRAGVRAHPREDAAPLWVPYLRVMDRAALDGLLARVPGAGGEVLVPATARPAGGHVALIRGPSGAGIALQTWPMAAMEAAE